MSALALFGGVTVLYAQPGPPPGTPAPAEGSASVSIKLSVPDMTARIPKVEKKMQEDAQRALYLKKLAGARLGCLFHGGHDCFGIAFKIYVVMFEVVCYIQPERFTRFAF